MCFLRETVVFTTKGMGFGVLGCYFCWLQKMFEMQIENLFVLFSSHQLVKLFDNFSNRGC